MLGHNVLKIFLLIRFFWHVINFSRHEVYWWAKIRQLSVKMSLKDGTFVYVHLHKTKVPVLLL